VKLGWKSGLHVRAKVFESREFSRRKLSLPFRFLRVLALGLAERHETSLPLGREPIVQPQPVK
jgi:hypothetical protein